LNESKNLIIFDLDGTLVDSLPDIVAALNHTAERLDFKSFLPEKVRTFVGDGVSILIDRAFPVTQSVRKEALDLFLTYYRAHLVDRTRPFPGIESLLAELKEDGFRMGVVANKLEKLSRTVVENFPVMRDALSFVYGGDSFQEKKPSPLPVREILKKWDGVGGNAVIVGDSHNDIRSGKSAGIQTIAVTYGFMSARELKSENPDILVNTPGELREAIACLMKR